MSEHRPTVPRPLVHVGNDVVDTRAPRTRGKAADTRFLRRVFAEEERACIAAASDPDLELWRIWAAKETAYKIASKLRGEPPPFVHAQFVVRWHALPDPGSAVRRGEVLWEDLVCSVAVGSEPGLVHAVGYQDGRGRSPESIGLGAEVALLDAPVSLWSGTEEELVARLTPREAASVHSRASAAVRIGARAALAAALDVPQARLEIVSDADAKGRRPPRLLLDGQAAEWDVSLSHDGDWIAWAWATAPGEAAGLGG